MSSQIYRKWRWEAREMVGNSSLGATILAKGAGWKKNLVRKDSTICIEGFPRSGNTFSVAAFLYSQPSTGHIARHSHLAGQVKKSLKLGVPTIVLIRKPIDAISSLLIRNSLLTPEQGFAAYLNFYQQLESVKESFVIAEFSVVTSDFGMILEKVNQKFKTVFKPFEMTPESEKECFQICEKMDKEDQNSASVSEDHVGRPSGERNKKKQEIVAILESSAFKKELAAANELYGRYLPKCRAGSAGSN